MGILKNRNFLIVLGIVIMGVMGGSIIGPILPAIAGAFDVSQEMVGWVMSVYTFFALVFTPLLGALADRVGRKKVLVPTILVFGVAGGLITLSPNFITLLILRGVQGICVASMMNLGVTLIGDLFEGRDRAKAMGYRTSAQNIVNAFAPFLSGALGVLAWFYPFLLYLLAIPLGFFVLSQLKVVEVRKEGGLRKYISSSLMVIRNPVAIWTFFGNFSLFVLLFVIVIYMPILVTDELGLTTAHAGLVISLGAGVSGIIASQAGRLSKFRSQLLVSGGFFLCSLALFCISTTNSFIGILFCMLIWGNGFGLILPSLTNTAASQAPTELRAGFMSIFSMMIFLGQTVSPPVFGVVLKYAGIYPVFMYGSLFGLIPLGYSLIMYFKVVRN